MNVLKKDGTVQAFDSSRVSQALVACGLTEGQAKDLALAIEVALREEVTTHVTVNDVHDEVESRLKHIFPDAYKSYHSYRMERIKEAEQRSELMQGFLGVVKQSNKEALRENANKPSEQLPVIRDLIAGDITRQYVLKHMLPKHVASAHNEGVIHVHDTDYIGLPMTNCCLVDVQSMLESGFKMGAAQIESPKSLLTAVAITAQITAQVACNQFGGTAIPDIDLLWEPYVHKSWAKHHLNAEKWVADDIVIQDAYADEMTKRDIVAAVQGYEYEINTMQTSNGQQPFTTITFGKGTSWACREIQKAYLNQRIKGLGKEGITPVFPKICFFRSEGVNKTPDDPNYDIYELAIECTSKRMYPDYLDVQQLERVTGGSPSPMGCRAFLPTYLSPHTEEHPYYGRCNLGVVTINLPYIALSSEGLEDFWEQLDKVVVLAKDALNVRVETCKGIQAKVAPILYMEGAFGLRTKDPEEYVWDRFFANGRASISLGYIGLYEVSQALFGVGHHESEESNNFCQEVLAYLKRKTQAWKEAEGIAYSLYGTPSEGLCGKAHDACKRKFGVIPNITDKGYLQNGYNVDVRADINPFDKVLKETPFPPLASAGFICYGEFPNMQRNLSGLKGSVSYALDYVPHYAVNTPTDKCYECQYQGEMEPTTEGFECPRCGNADTSKMSVVRRVSGYLTALNQRKMPTGKYAEVLVRKKNL